MTVSATSTTGVAETDTFVMSPELANRTKGFAVPYVTEGLMVSPYKTRRGKELTDASDVTDDLWAGITAEYYLATGRNPDQGFIDFWETLAREAFAKGEWESGIDIAADDDE